MVGKDVYELLESLQYGMLYIFFAFAGGVGLDYLIPVYDEKKPINEVSREVIAQALLLIATVYFVRYIVKSVPIDCPYPRGNSYIPYKTAEFNGEMMMGFVFLSSQLNMLNKIDLLSKQIYKLFFKEERKLQDKAEREVTLLENGVAKKVKIVEKRFGL